MTRLAIKFIDGDGVQNTVKLKAGCSYEQALDIANAIKGWGGTDVSIVRI